MSESKSIGFEYSSQKIFAQNLSANSAGGLPKTNGKFGGMGGNIDEDAGLPFSKDGICPPFESIDIIFSVGGVFDENSNPFELFFGGSLAPFGLNRSESYAIKSLGTFLTLQALTFAKQFNFNLHQNTSLSSKGMQQG